MCARLPFPPKAFEVAMQLSSSVRYVAWLDTIAMSYLLGVTAWLYGVVLLDAMPALYATDGAVTYAARVVAWTYVAASIVINFCAVRRWHSFVGSGAAGGGGDKSLAWCRSCEQPRPPAAHHCSLCARCVVRRDHHCYACGVCVGARNHRHFLALCAYATAGTCYAVYATNAHFSRAFPHVSVYGRLFPVALYRFVFGDDSARLLHASAACSVAALSVAIAVVMCSVQSTVVTAGATMYTFWRGRRRWHAGIAHNVREVFGAYWLVQFIVPVPWIAIPLVSDVSEVAVKHGAAHPD